jgi:NAD(P)-dependent dehydrogenase (short-subunit alcohol dehydrogenase family)
MHLWASRRWLVSSLPVSGSAYSTLLILVIGLDHSPEGIRVNAVCPTWVRTPLLDEELQKNPEVQGMISAVVPIKRAAECEEVSDVVAFLCSPAASYINGTSLLIDAAVTTTVRLF